MARRHVIMTGPGEWEWSGTLDPATGAFRRNDIKADVL
jgi:diaminopimelate epimerase